MMHKDADQEVEIRAHSLLDIRDGEGLGVFCVDGVVWITQSDDSRDLIVHAGQSFILDRPGLALVATPVGPAIIRLRTATSDRHKRSGVALSAGED